MFGIFIAINIYVKNNWNVSKYLKYLILVLILYKRNKIKEKEVLSMRLTKTIGEMIIEFALAVIFLTAFLMMLYPFIKWITLFFMTEKGMGCLIVLSHWPIWFAMGWGKDWDGLCFIIRWIYSQLFHPILESRSL